MKQTFKGKLRRSPFSGGWLLSTDDGRELTLSGAIDSDLNEGARVVVRATLRDDLASIDMTGPVLEVHSLERA